MADDPPTPPWSPRNFRSYHCEMTFIPARTLEDVLKVALPAVAVADVPVG